MRTSNASTNLARRIGATAALLVAALAVAGCTNDVKLVSDLQKRVDALESDLTHCTQQLADRDGRIAILKRRIDNAPLLVGVEVDDLFVVDRIIIASRSGGADYDGQPGDDGVTVYVQPVDADGDALKAAGQITVQLTDLSTPGDPRDIATHVFAEREQLRKCWYGGLLTDHYTLKCPFPPNAPRPRSREVHVRITFLDWLTGREFTESATVQIDRIDPENALVPRKAGS